MDVDLHLDPEIAEALAASNMGAVDFGTIEYDRLPGLRTAMNQARPPSPPTDVLHRDVQVPGAEGDPEVTLRIFTPPGQRADRGVLYWIHGGGYMFGSTLVPEPRLERWASEFDCVIVSVEYRLAPETSYPGPLDDCYAGLAWTVGHASELGVDATRAVIGGASAGAVLAAALALLARDRGDIPIGYQLLIYPMIDDRNANPSTHIDRAPVWPRPANLLGWRAYLGQEPGGDDVPAYAAPARAEDLSGLPPAWIGVGTLDVFRDEDI
ncbi:MAG: alpha/beta hydrolase, partial [Acidimicrobiales bacterium]|nr:alpha/beta hydrolase [Acidimicrobiales bacterium]